MLARFFVASALVAAVAAQSASTTVSQSMPPVATAGFNPGNVSSTDAFNWCQAQTHVCTDVCGGSGQTSSNTCDPTTFTFSCICVNGTEPDCSAYAQSLQFYICQATFMQCINAHPMDAEGQATCTSNEKCGSLNATALTASSGSGTSAASSMSTMASAAASSAASATASVASSAASAASASATSSSSSSGAAGIYTHVSSSMIASGALVAALAGACAFLL